ncbi:MAG: DUF402 domain-containing protein [Nocardioides sp.]|uniref:DUF402 domain-containing protein n=1 Tax=Nocardioides sp. TaxID=35761 RepID=UPI0039E33B4B
MTRLPSGTRIHVEMTKWGGRPHWSFDGVYLGADEHGDWLGHPVGTRYARPGRRFVADWLAVSLVPHHDAAHLVAFNRPNDEIGAEVYVDMSTPAIWEDTVLRAVDLDLDVARRWDGAVELLDEDEFEAHQVEYGYPPEIITMAEESAARVYAAVNGREAPYDETTAQAWFALLEELGG